MDESGSAVAESRVQRRASLACSGGTAAQRSAPAAREDVGTEPFPQLQPGPRCHPHGALPEPCRAVLGAGRPGWVRTRSDVPSAAAAGRLCPGSAAEPVPPELGSGFLLPCHTGPCPLPTAVRNGAAVGIIRESQK